MVLKRDLNIYETKNFLLIDTKIPTQRYISLAILNGVIKSFPRPFLETLTVLFFIISIGLLFQYNYDKTYILLILTLIISASVKLMPSAVKIINIYQQLKFLNHLQNLFITNYINLRIFSFLIKS